jgi:hypothetical protein
MPGRARVVATVVLLALAGSACAQEGAVVGVTAASVASAPEARLASQLPHRLRQSLGRTYYVSPAGSDANPGSSERPWRTVQHALDRLRPGERVLVHAGTYTEDIVIDRAGTASAPITVAAYPGERVVLHAAATSGDTYPVRFSSGAAFIRLQRFVIERARGTSSTNVYFEGDVHHVELSGNEIRFSQDQGVFAEATTRSLHIVGNRIHDNGLGHEADQHQSHGLYIEGNDHLIANNVVYDHPFGFGIQLYPENVGTVVVNNTVVTSAHSGIVVGGSGGVANITIRNNILAFNGRYGVQTDRSCPVGRVVVDTNVFYGNADGAVEKACSELDVSGGNRTSSPRFVDLGGRDLRLRAGSAAIDYARPGFSPAVDIDRHRRPSGAGSDAGAYERAA